MQFILNTRKVDLTETIYFRVIEFFNNGVLYYFIFILVYKFNLRKVSAKIDPVRILERTTDNFEKLSKRMKLFRKNNIYKKTFNFERRVFGQWTLSLTKLVRNCCLDDLRIVLKQILK